MLFDAPVSNNWFDRKKKILLIPTTLFHVHWREKLLFSPSPGRRNFRFCWLMNTIEITNFCLSNILKLSSRFAVTFFYYRFLSVFSFFSSTSRFLVFILFIPFWDFVTFPIFLQTSLFPFSLLSLSLLFFFILFSFIFVFLASHFYCHPLATPLSRCTSAPSLHRRSPRAWPQLRSVVWSRAANKQSFAVPRRAQLPCVKSHCILTPLFSS